MDGIRLVKEGTFGSYYEVDYKESVAIPNPKGGIIVSTRNHTLVVWGEDETDALVEALAFIQAEMPGAWLVSIN